MSQGYTSGLPDYRNEFFKQCFLFFFVFGFCFLSFFYRTNDGLAEFFRITSNQGWYSIHD